jgi:hypothetical protein
VSEAVFLTVYGSPLLQAALGIDPADTRRRPRSGGARFYLRRHAASCCRRAVVKSDPAPAIRHLHGKDAVREQYFMLVLDQQAALAATPGLLPEDLIIRRTVFELLKKGVGQA